MKQNSITVITLAVIAFSPVLSVSKLLAQPEGASASLAGTGPAIVTASLAGSSTVSLGEPILLKIAIKNSSELQASIFTKETDGSALVSEDFAEVNGKSLVPSASRLASHYSSHTLKMMDGLSIIGNSSWSWKILANARVNFPHPGNYILRVQVRMPYVIGDIDQGVHYVLSDNYAFPLKVVAANPAYLHSTAERLRGAILRTTGVEERATLIQALFLIPQANAAASWRSLIEEPKLDGMALNEIAAALEGIQTNEAADLLAEMFWNPLQSPDAIAEASIFQHFYGMYDAGTPELKKHIEGLHKQNGVAMPQFRME